MAKTEEDLRKEQAALKELEEEEARKKRALEDDQTPKKTVPEGDEAPKTGEESSFKPDKPDGDWAKIVDDFKEKYKREPEPNGALRFDTREDAVAFFTEQATKEPPREFFCSKLEDGQLVDDHMFSCGSGQLFEGSLKQIQAQVKEALEKDPENPKLKQGQEMIDKRVAAMEKSAAMRSSVGTMRDEGTKKDEPELNTGIRPKNPGEL